MEAVFFCKKLFYYENITLKNKRFNNKLENFHAIIPSFVTLITCVYNIHRLC